MEHGSRMEHKRLVSGAEAGVHEYNVKMRLCEHDNSNDRGWVPDLCMRPTVMFCFSVSAVMRGIAPHYPHSCSIEPLSGTK